MNIEIRTLTGPDQGSHKILDTNRLWIGDTQDCDIQFDGAQIPEAAGRCVEIKFTEQGWSLSNIGSGEIRINQDFVDGPCQLKTGDVIRLSENGPDFSFGLVRPGVMQSVEADDTSSAPALGIFFGGVWSVITSSLYRYRMVAIGIVLLLFLIAGYLCMPGSRAPDDTVIIQIGSGLQREIPEQEPWRFPVPLDPSNTERSHVHWLLTEDVPPGMTIDQEGVIQWTPTESDGPGSYELTVVARHGDSPESSARLTVAVTEVNRKPVVKPIPTVILDATNDYTMDFEVQATDPDQPAIALRYELSPSAPDGMTIDPMLGRIRWVANESQRGESYAVMVTVSEENDPAAAMSVPFLVRSTVAKRSQGVKEAMYLVTLTSPNGQQEYPLANAVALTSDSLLTTAVVAHEIQRRKQQDDGFAINVVLGSDGVRESVRDVLVPHSTRELSDDPAAQIYVDLGILKVQDRPDRVVVELASETELQTMESGHPLHCLVIKHTGEPLTSFYETAPTFYEARVNSVERLIPDHPGPSLLAFLAELPKNSHGAAVLNAENQLLAVLAETAFFPEDSDLVELNGRLHYAPDMFLLAPSIAQDVDLEQDWESVFENSDESLREP